MIKFHVPKMTDADMVRHMFLVLVAGSLACALGGNLTGAMFMWAANWIFECVRDSR